ncbi:TBC domain protein [Poronia punctata]|nr:TBC domain protein [Poronia punctata]
MESEQAATSIAIERSSSQLSSLSTKSNRGDYTVRAKSRSRKLTSQPSSSASSIAASDKSLTSFPSFSPQQDRHDETLMPAARGVATGNPQMSKRQASKSIVESLTSIETPKNPRNALFEDTPVPTRKIPGALHLAEPEYIERLITKHGAVDLVRQVAEDLAQRDVQIANLRRRADERERALRRIIIECGLSNLELETKLRLVEREQKELDRSKRRLDDGLSNLMNDAMQDSLSQTAAFTGSGIDEGLESTAQNASPGTPLENNKGTIRGWKQYLWGTGTGRKSRSVSIKSVNGEGAKTAIRAPITGDRRPPIQEDLFTPPESGSTRSSSRASSIYSTHTTRKPSSSLASMALQLVAGKTNYDTIRGRSDSAGHAGSLRTSSAASTKTGASARGNSSQSGPKALMSMRRSTPSSASLAQRTQLYDRRDMLGTSPDDASNKRLDNYVPVEMDTIFSPEGQPPTLTHIYNNFNNAEYLTDRFGFIYDQRRKMRQREATQVATRIKRGSRAEMLSGGRLSLSPSSFDDDTNPIRDVGINDRPGSPSSASSASMDQGRPKRWQDYLKIATFPTELLSHTPVATSGIEVLEGHEQPKSPGLITTNARGLMPSATTTAALDSNSTAKMIEEASGTLVHEDAEPVKLLLKQLSDVHDALQREKAIRWNEFLRKVRAERKREGEAAAAAAAAAAEARFQRAPVMIPEAKLTDGETIGIADLGFKGKVGRAKWNEFRNLVLGGIPVANRPKIWAECSGALSIRVPGYYESLVSRSDKDDDPIVVSQIDMDINRTLTDNIFFRRGPGVAKLSEVLRAYARRNPEVGYCQGMNLITANLLLIMPSTEDTFWVLVSIVERILPLGYYDHSLMASRADQVVLRQYVSAVLPKLSQHLDNLGIELEALTFQWFLSVFTDCLSAEALFRVWDVVLCISDGSTFLFQVALALLKLNERQLLQCDTPAAIYTYINHQMTNHAISIDGLIQASEGLRKVVRREEIEDRRNKAIDAERRLMKEREENAELHRHQKSLSAPALVTEASASAVPSPACSSTRMDAEAENMASCSTIDLDEERGSRDTGDLNISIPTPAEEEAQLGLG